MAGFEVTPYGRFCLTPEAGKNYSLAFAASILAVTRPEQLVKPEKDTEQPDAYAMLEETTDTLVTDLAAARRTYGADVLSLSVVCRCIENLTGNAKVAKYLKLNHAEVFGELQHLVSQVNAERLPTQ